MEDSHILEKALQLVLVHTSKFQFEAKQFKIWNYLWGQSPENEAVEKGSFWVRLSGEGTSYVIMPGELYIRGKSKVHPEAAHLLCVVEIVVWWAMQAVEVAYPHWNDYSRAEQSKG